MAHALESQGAHESNGTLRVQERDGKGVFGTKAIPQHVGSHAASGKPVGNLATFEVAAKVYVSAARRNDYGRPILGAGYGTKDRQYGHVEWACPLCVGSATLP